MIEKSTYQLVSEPSILGFDGSNTKAEEMETEVLHEDVYQLKEQIRLNSEKLDRSLAELRQTISMLSSNKGNRHNSQYNFSSLQKASYDSPTKCLKIELSKFYGENAIDWLYQCEHNFEINRTPEQSRVEVAVMHMEGKALQWYKILLRGRLTREPPRWKEFVDALRFQFVNDPIRELTKLKQIGSIRVYSNQFDGIENCWNISKYDAINLFLMGLREEIQSVVQKFKLNTLRDAYCLAKLQE
ncbi:hypothetical protein BUALT_Bualt12G0061600 [Buddleja alternifolia]|uniref:Retrotransposon gag domain-containing protein n=1 Tax=Buddleja alternifolia TaxID=168488 RepID=A0AAV6WQC4_9LAMI|nr:hypothetical protein BUALT_Bualt12G0061600 [Buddleja alternifolia]